MTFKSRSIICAITTFVGMGGAGPASAAGDMIKIGFITDLSGVYSDIDGNGGVEAIKMAIADLNGSVGGKKIVLVLADNTNMRRPWCTKPWCGNVIKPSIAFYAALETCLGQEGVALDSEFFLDAEGREQITAREAERIRHADPMASLFHSLYVIEAAPKTRLRQVIN